MDAGLVLYILGRAADRRDVLGLIEGEQLDAYTTSYRGDYV